MLYRLSRFTAIMVACLLSHAALAWDYEGHRIVNQLALAGLPTNFPSFALTLEARERIAFLSGEPDRWRNTTELTLKHFNSPDHFLDIEELALHGMDPRTVSPFRYEFTAQLAINRARYSTNFPAIDPARNTDRTRELIGFLPWTITEYYGKLKSGFSYLKALEEGGTAEEVANARQNIIYIMGVMGHFVGDAGQPLHSTIHHNGWVGPNPNRYSTNKTIHLWIDGGYINYAGIQTSNLLDKVQPAKLLVQSEAKANQAAIFLRAMDYLLEQHKLVEPLYQLDRSGKFSSRKPVSDEGYNFITGQLLKSGQLLGSLWLTAWQTAPVDSYLKTQLTKRRLSAEKVQPSEPKNIIENEP